MTPAPPAGVHGRTLGALARWCCPLAACAVFTVGGSEELALVLEFSEHGSLKEMITAPSKMARAFTVSEGLRWACDIASGMAFLHRCIPPIIHRDLKPANIMLCGPSRIAKVRSTLRSAPTPLLPPPCQARRARARAPSQVADFGLASLEISKLKDEARSLSIKAARSASSTNLEAMAGGGGGGSGGAKGVPPTGGVGSLRYMVRAHPSEGATLAGRDPFRSYGRAARSACALARFARLHLVHEG